MFQTVLTLDGCDDAMSRWFFRTKIVDNSCTCFFKHPPSVYMGERGEKRGVGRCVNGAGVDRDLKTDPGSSPVLSCLVRSED